MPRIILDIPLGRRGGFNTSQITSNDSFDRSSKTLNLIVFRI